MTTIGVLALQGGFAEHITALRRLGVRAIEVRLPAQLTGLDGLILPGGESTTMSRLLHRWGLHEPIRARVQDGLAVWGTCAGAILLAERAAELDGSGLALMAISVERNAFGRQVDSFEAALEIPVLGREPFPAVFIRAPLIAEVGEAAEPLATLAGGEVVAARQGNRLATVFHPELTRDPRFHRYFLDIVTEGQPAETRAEPAAAPR